MRCKHFVFASALLVAAPAAFAVIVCGDNLGLDDPPLPVSAPGNQLPNYVQLDNGEPDRARQKVWDDYQFSLYESLRNGSAPRDRALATLLPFWAEEDSSGNKDPLLQRAADAAPDDMLVQWIAAHHGHPASALAARALRVREPENAAVWVDDLSAAATRRDNEGIDAALAKMSAARRFDAHYVDLLQAVVEVYSRHPIPDAYLLHSSEEEKSLGAEGYAPVHAMTIAAASGLPALQDLVNACRIEPVSGTNRERAADCAAIGRLMVARGDTLLANRIGAVLLRVSHTSTDDDLQTMRNIDWAYQNSVGAQAAGTETETARDLVERYRDWIETGSEVESMRRALARKGVPPTPPGDWTDTWSVFSTERQRADAEWLAVFAPK